MKQFNKYIWWAFVIVCIIYNTVEYLVTNGTEIKMWIVPIFGNLLISMVCGIHTLISRFLPQVFTYIYDWTFILIIILSVLFLLMSDGLGNLYELWLFGIMALVVGT